jgi:hypothetical protein
MDKNRVQGVSIGRAGLLPRSPYPSRMRSVDPAAVHGRRLSLPQEICSEQLDPVTLPSQQLGCTGLFPSRLVLSISRDGQKAPVLGTCFAFCNPKFLSPRRTLSMDSNQRRSSLQVETSDGQRKPGTARSVVHHPNADIAILEIDRPDLAGSTDFFKSVARPIMGQDFFHLVVEPKLACEHCC